MKLYAVIGGWNNEGHDKPIGIFSTKELAEAAKASAYTGYDSVEIVEYDLNKAKE